jgi:hypothetical protein
LNILEGNNSRKFAKGRKVAYKRIDIGALPLEAHTKMGYGRYDPEEQGWKKRSFSTARPDFKVNCLEKGWSYSSWGGSA